MRHLKTTFLATLFLLFDKFDDVACVESKAKVVQSNDAGVHELPPYFIPLTSDNFDYLVMNSKEAWVILFHKGTVDPSWIEKSDLINIKKGISWTGTVDTSKYPTISETIVSFKIIGHLH